MAGKRQRGPDQLVDRRPQRRLPLTVLTEAFVDTPPAPADIDDEAVRLWMEFWNSPVARTVTWSAHREALEHWIRCVSKRHRLWDTWTKQPLIRGSHDQLVTNPLYRQIKSLDHYCSLVPLAGQEPHVHTADAGILEQCTLAPPLTSRTSRDHGRSVLWAVPNPPLNRSNGPRDRDYRPYL